MTAHDNVKVFANEKMLASNFDATRSTNYNTSYSATKQPIRCQSSYKVTDFSLQLGRVNNVWVDEHLDDRFRQLTCARTEKTVNLVKKKSNLISRQAESFTKSAPRGLTQVINQGPLKISESASISNLHVDGIEARKKRCRSVLAFDKQKQRDDSMYQQSMLSKNIELENSKEERLYI